MHRAGINGSFRFFHGRAAFRAVVTPAEMVVNAGLFPGNPADYEHQQYHDCHTNRRPKPHSSTHPSAHPSVGIVHHKISLVLLRQRVIGNLRQRGWLRHGVLPDRVEIPDRPLGKKYSDGD